MKSEADEENNVSQPECVDEHYFTEVQQRSSPSISVIASSSQSHSNQQPVAG